MDSKLHTGPVATCGHSYPGTCPGLASHITLTCTCPQTAPGGQLRTPMSCPYCMCRLTCGSTETAWTAQWYRKKCSTLFLVHFLGKWYVFFWGKSFEHFFSRALFFHFPHFGLFLGVCVFFCNPVTFLGACHWEGGWVGLAAHMHLV